MATAADTALIEPVDLSSSSRPSTSLFSVMWQRKPLVILGVIIALICGSLFYAQRQPIYQSGAQILVVKKSVNTMPGQGNQTQMTYQEDYMSSQTVLLKSFVIAQRAAYGEKVKNRLESEGFKSFPEAKKPDELIPEIMKNLTVTRENREANQNTQGNNVLLLTFRATDREEAMIILESIIKGYQEFIDKEYADLSEKVVREINRMRTELNKANEDAEKALADFYKTSPIHTTKIAGGTSEVQKKAVDLSDRVTKADIELKSKEYDLTRLKELYDTRGPQATIQYIISAGQRLSQVTGDPETDRMLLQLKLAESDALGQFGENHPRVKSIRSQITQLKQDLLNRDSNKAVDKNTDLAKMFIENLEIDVKTLRGKLAFFQAEYDKVLEEVKNLSRYELEESRLRDERARANMMFQEVARVVRDADLKKESGGFKVVPITPPGPGIKVAPNGYQVFPASALLGVLLGIGLAYLAEISDKSFRNPNEIRKRLGLPVIGHVPYLAADERAQQLIAAGSSTVDPMLITHYQSNSIGAEAYRGVRTSLYFSTQGAGHQVIQVTSPNVSDGKSTLAANLAVSIAQSGKRTLLVDCDFRKPRVHKIFNVPATVGMASVMVGQADLNSAAQPTVIPNLSVMPCGPRPANPAELLTSPRFKELLEELRSKYDFVVVDTPPVLVVTDPAVVAPRVDGVVLCIRVTKNGRPFAERAREVLASVGANVLGVVVNGFGAHAGGNRYGYEHYNYGEGYSYTYGYTYGYADKEAASYYAAGHDEKPAAATEAGSKS